MEASFGGSMDPVPFILGAYLLGALMIAGYMIWTLVERRRLLHLLAAVSFEQKKSPHTSQEGGER